MKVRAEIYEGRVGLTSPYDERAIRKYKEIPGARWDRVGKLWKFPLEIASCRLLRHEFGADLEVGPILARWARAEIARLTTLSEMAAAHDADLRVIPSVAPRMARALSDRPYQRVGVRFLADNRSLLLADDPTLGKSIQYLGGLIEAEIFEGPHLVLAPKSSLSVVWEEEIHKWTDGIAYVMPDGRAKREKILDAFMTAPDEEPSFLLCNPEMIRIEIHNYCKKCDRWIFDRNQEMPDRHWLEQHTVAPMRYACDWPELFEVDWSSVIVDECHKVILGIKSALGRNQTGQGLYELHTMEGAIRMGSTGTPIKGKVRNFWPTLYWLNKKRFSAKWKWIEAWLDVEKTNYGKTVKDLRKDREEHFWEAHSDIILRRAKREVQPDLPEDMYINHWVRMLPKQAKQYKELIDEGEAELEGGMLSANGILAEYTRRKQFAYGVWTYYGRHLLPTADSPKFQFILDWLEKRGIGKGLDERIDPIGYKYILVSQFTDILVDVSARLEMLGIGVASITGKVSGSRRKDAVVSFQGDGGSRVLLLNVMAGGSALTLDAHCDEMLLLDETWVRDDMIQVEGRIRNRDVERRVAVRTYHYLRTRDTVEQEIADSGLTQDEYQKRILDRRRGIAVPERSIT
jgi:SNF2 family DNA or RNA helicase